MSEIITRVRNADIEEIMDVLNDQEARRADVIVPSSLMRYERGNLVLASGKQTQLLGEDGVTDLAGSYRPTSVADEKMAERIGAHGGFMKAMRERGRYDVLDHVYNDLLHGGGSDTAAAAEWMLDHMDEDGATPPDFPEFEAFKGSIMLRLLKGDAGEEGVLRAALSGRYKIMDNLTVLLAIMEGIQKAGVQAIPSEFDLSDKKLYGRFEVPGLAIMAPKLLEGYRSPFDGVGGAERAGGDRPGMRLRSERGGWSPQAALDAAAREGLGYEPGKEPIVWAGFVVSNSDVGYGSRTIRPQIRVRVCRNGLTLMAESDSRIHLGGQQEEGVVDWSLATQEKELALITAQTSDLVAQWMTPEWFGGQVAAIEALAGTPIPDPEPVIKAVATSVKFTKADAAGILDHFRRAGQYTSGGIGNAVTSFSQTVGDADRAADLDSKAVPAMAAAVKAAARL
jgi:hypothetical protein